MAAEIRVRVADIPEGGMKQVDAGDDKVLFIRDADGVRAFQSQCPHYGAPLAKGVICGKRLYCPWHKAVFNVADGRLEEPPALEPLDRYPVRIEGDEAIASLAEEKAETARTGGGDKTVVIVGTGAAAVAAVTTLRREGFEGRIVMIGRERFPPYDRPMLSKNFLSKATEAKQALLEPDFFDAHQVERVEGSAKAVDPAARTVAMDNGDTITADALVVATGSRAVAPDFEGRELDGIVTLRSLDDAVRLTGHAETAERIVIVGGGFIGLEAAAVLRKRGLDVTVVTTEDVPLAKRFGEPVGTAIRSFHEGNGIRFRQGTVSRFVGDGAVREVELDDGTKLEADIVLIAAGAAPETDLIEGCEKREDGGIAVRPDLSIADGVWLAGDIAAFPDHGSGSTARIEHWRLAQQHGMHVARAILGSRAHFTGTPFFWTNQGAKRLDYAGFTPGFDRLIMRGDPEKLDFIAYYVKDDRVVAACSIGRNTEFIAFLDRLDHDRVPPPAEIERGVELAG